MRKTAPKEGPKPFDKSPSFVGLNPPSRPRKEAAQMKRAIGFFVVFFFLALVSGGKALSQDLSSLIHESFTKKALIKAFSADLSMEEAIRVQQRFVSLLEKDLGKPLGYKAGLTNPKAQEAFGVKEPVLGVMLEKMFLKSGSKLPAQFGARPVMEGDLIVRVASDKINEIKSPGEAIDFIDQVIPFIELPDLMYDPGLKMTGPMIVAINVGARFGILGEPIQIGPGADWAQRLKEFGIQLLDQQDQVLAEGKGEALLGDPLKVVFWIKERLLAQGKGLKKGDLLSLGSVTKMLPPKPASTVKARYSGLDPKGPVEISVQFE
jgi:2-keto-4-pentenoate hydratase